MQFPRFPSSSVQDPEEDDLDWAHIIYARVLLQMFEDLEKSQTRELAIVWFRDEIYEVALVCALCRTPPVNVYKAVVRQLHEVGMKAGRINLIRRYLRRGQVLHRVTQQLRSKAA